MKLWKYGLHFPGVQNPSLTLEYVCVCMFMYVTDCVDDDYDDDDDTKPKTDKGMNHDK